jgi:hypothetical protein
MKTTPFLARWLERRAKARSQTAAPADPAASRPSDDAPLLSQEELAKLPKISELTAETDITVFLRRGVPEAIRNQALRRAWMLDPAIRDFVGHARDYAYDWNTPGGAPGHGALEPSDDVSALVGRIFGESDRAEPVRQAGGAVEAPDAATEQEQAAEEPVTSPTNASS